VRIEIDKLEGTQGRFARAYGSEELALDDDRACLIAAPQVSGSVSRDRNQLILRGRLAAVAQVECDRCLQPVDVPVNVEFNLRYVTAAEYASLHAAELEDEDLALSVFDGEVIDVDELAREQILLAVPLRALCRPDCKGFCPECGADRNLKDCGCQTAEVDARWAELKNLGF
jgi:uncharacterized protein